MEHYFPCYDKILLIEADVYYLLNRSYGSAMYFSLIFMESFLGMEFYASPIILGEFLWVQQNSIKTSDPPLDKYHQQKTHMLLHKFLLVA